MPSRPRVRAALVIVATSCLAGCGDHGRTPARVALEECRLAHLPTAARCASVPVPLNRARPDGPSTDLAVAILPANTLSPKPDPLFMLPGGPGQSAEALAPLASALAGVRKERDIVLVDPRGAGRSAPLRCAALAPRDPFLDVMEAESAPAAVHACLAELRQRNVDLAQYTTEVYVADLEAVREALGYARVNLWGGSYGTRVAQHYLRRHPERVRSAVLDGVAPPSLRVVLDVWPPRDKILADAIAACAAAEACARAYPDLGASLARLESQLSPPRTVMVADPRTAAPREVRLGFDVVVGALQALVYLPELASIIPPLLARAEAGDLAPLFAASMSVGDELERTVSVPLHFAVSCGEDAPRVTPADAARVVAASIAPDLVRRGLAACAGWPQVALAADFAQPVTSDKPVLLLSGGLDPVTPPENAALVAATLPNSRQVVATGYGHIVSPHACAPQLIERFIEDAGFARLAQECVDALAASRRPAPFASLLSP